MRTGRTLSYAGLSQTWFKRTQVEACLGAWEDSEGEGLVSWV